MVVVKRNRNKTLASIIAELNKNSKKQVPKIVRTRKENNHDMAEDLFRATWKEFTFLLKDLLKSPVVIILMTIGGFFMLDLDINGIDDSVYKQIMDKIAVFPAANRVVNKYLIPEAQRIVSGFFFAAVFFAIKSSTGKVVIVMTAAASLLVFDTAGLNLVIAVGVFAFLEIKVWYVTATLAVFALIYAYFYLHTNKIPGPLTLDPNANGSNFRTFGTSRG